jgi:hypothetical protein
MYACAGLRICGERAEENKEGEDRKLESTHVSGWSNETCNKFRLPFIFCPVPNRKDSTLRCVGANGFELGYIFWGSPWSNLHLI